MLWKFVLFSFHSILDSVFLDSPSAPLFSLPAICAVDNNSSDPNWFCNFVRIKRPTASYTVYTMDFYMRVTDMIPQWSQPKQNCLKFQNINVHEGFTDTKLATGGSIVKNSSTTCCWCISGDCKLGVSSSYSTELNKSMNQAKRWKN